MVEDTRCNKIDEQMYFIRVDIATIDDNYKEIEALYMDGKFDGEKHAEFAMMQHHLDTVVHALRAARNALLSSGIEAKEVLSKRE